MKMLRVAKSRDMGPLFKENPHRMVGQDGAYSIPLSDGTALWYFGDTLIGNRRYDDSLWYPGGVQIGPGDMGGHNGIDILRTNTGAIVPPQEFSRGIQNFAHILDTSGSIKQLVPHASTESPDLYRVWCLHGIQLGDTIYLGYMIVRMLAEGPMPVNFEIVGSALARGNSADWSFNRIPAPEGDLWWHANEPQFGSCFVDGKDGFIYIYGVLRDSAGVQRAYVARVLPGKMENRAAYEFYQSSSNQWLAELGQASSIMTGMPNEMSVSWNAYLSAWLAVHSLDLSGAIVARTAPNPWGPWSEPTTLWQVVPPKLPYTVPYGCLIYAGKEHPEMSPDGGKTLYLTYIEFEEYFPHLVEVILE